MPDSYLSASVNLGDSFAKEEWQRGLVLNSIRDIRAAINRWRVLEADPSAPEEDRLAARQAIAYREREFGGQWRNVESLLERFKEK